MTLEINDRNGNAIHAGNVEGVREFIVTARHDPLERGVLKQEDGLWQVDRMNAKPYPSQRLGNVQKTNGGRFQPIPYLHRASDPLPSPRDTLLDAVMSLS